MSGVVYVLINKGANMKFTPFVEQYRVFQDRESALSAFLKARGGEKGFMWPPDLSEVGMASHYACGDVDVMLIPVLLS